MKKEEIKIGQKVKVSEEFDWRGCGGKVGTIVEGPDADGDFTVYLGKDFDGHYGYHQNNPHNVIVSVERLTLVEDKPVSKFKVGDIVTVVNKGETYGTYDEFFKENNCEGLLENWKFGSPKNNYKYKVVFIGKHEWGHTLLVIQSPRTKRVYIIGEKGVELYTKPTFNAGDKVKIRQWDDMEAEFGVDRDGNIKCTHHFTTCMRNLCGEEFTITSIDDDCVNGLDTYYNISTDMLELVVETKDESKSTTTFKVGDKVRIRKWKDMKAEFGLTISGSVACMFSFTERMKHLCGKEFTITDIQSDGEVLGLKTGWTISTDMIELVVESKPEPSKLVVGAKVKVVNPQFSDFSDWGGKIGMIGTIVNVSEQHNGQDYLVYLGEDFDGHDGMCWVSERQDNKHNYFFKAEEIEVVESILDAIEIKYLTAVIKPFRKQIEYIAKIGSGAEAYIEIGMNDGDTAVLPSFKKSTGMYAGMQINQEYSLKELGL